MKFKLIASNYFYPKSAHRKRLEKYGFQFITYVGEPDSHHVNDNYEPEIEINNLEDLLKLRREMGSIVISSFCGCKDCLTGDTEHLTIEVGNW